MGLIIGGEPASPTAERGAGGKVCDPAIPLVSNSRTSRRRSCARHRRATLFKDRAKTHRARLGCTKKIPVRGAVSHASPAQRFLEGRCDTVVLANYLLLVVLEILPRAAVLLSFCASGTIVAKRFYRRRDAPPSRDASIYMCRRQVFTVSGRYSRIPR